MNLQGAQTLLSMLNLQCEVFFTCCFFYIVCGTDYLCL